MKLTTNELRKLAHGAISVKEQEDGYTAFYRFSDAQMEYYRATNAEFYTKTFCTACVRIEMMTDATELAFTYLAQKASSRKFFYFDLFVDGVMVAHEGADDTEGTQGRITLPLPAGTHRVALYLPALFKAMIKDVTLKDATLATPVVKKLKMLSMGDSITHGYDAKYSSQSYVNILADMLDASVVNQGIGAEVFNPGLVDGGLGFTPDIITVAYGTNDYSKREHDELVRDAGEFYARLRRAFPTAKIFALLPIWRGDNHRITKVGTFDEAKALVRQAAEAQENVVVLDGNTFVPHLPEFFSDKHLHPNDIGFKCYADALFLAMQKHLG